MILTRAHGANTHAYTPTQAATGDERQGAGTLRGVKTTIRTAGPAATAAVAAQLADAFASDPVMCWIWPDTGQRRVGMRRLFAAQLRYHHVPNGGVQYVADPPGEVLGSAVWDPPGHGEPRTATTLRSVPALVAALGTRIRPALALRAALDGKHPSTPHWYLNKIGTAPQVRGQGVGAALLVSRLRHCDQTRTDAYLECTREETIGYYERHGFTVTQQIQVPGRGPSLWGMLRRPS